MSNMELIKQLRELTAAGMADCKSALEETNWDLQKAVDVVKVKGLNFADSRASKIAAEGRIFMRDSMMAEVNSQTDFVANSEGFISFGQSVLDHLSGSVSADVLEDTRKRLVATTRENIVVRRTHSFNAEKANYTTFSYLHSNHKIGVLVRLFADNEVNSTAIRVLGDNLAMQIAALNPLAVDSSGISSEEVERQKAIFQTQLAEDPKPKPAAMQEKILEGKMKRWFQEVCLLDQDYLPNPKQKVRQVIDSIGKIEVASFVRYQVGEGIQHSPSGDFADEVNKLAGQ
jgi:elongation factor Ts